MIVTRKHLPRRTFLRGAGAMLALPFLDSMAPAFADTAKSAANPRRLAWDSSMFPTESSNRIWLPKAEGANFEFNATAKALEPFRDSDPGAE